VRSQLRSQIRVALATAASAVEDVTAGVGVEDFSENDDMLYFTTISPPVLRGVAGGE
jgi:hypothetical protein